MAQAGKKLRSGQRRYVALLYSILELPGLELRDKVVLAYVHGFGEKGCWAGNAGIAEQLKCSKYAVSRSIAKLKQRGYIVAERPNGPRRKLWSRPFAPAEVINKRSACAEVTLQNPQGNRGKTARSPQRRRCTIINNDKEKDNKEITAPASPLPAEGQAKPVSAERQKQIDANIAEMNRRIEWRKTYTRISPEQLEQRRNAQLAALRAENDRPVQPAGDNDKSGQQQEAAIAGQTSSSRTERYDTDRGDEAGACGNAQGERLNQSGMVCSGTGA